MDNVIIIIISPGVWWEGADCRVHKEELSRGSFYARWTSHAEYPAYHNIIKELLDITVCFGQDDFTRMGVATQPISKQGRIYM